jgi:hypothetical protein
MAKATVSWVALRIMKWLLTWVVGMGVLACGDSGSSSAGGNSNTGGGGASAGGNSNSGAGGGAGAANQGGGGNCTPDCGTKMCGSDGCDGNCGVCGPEDVCSSAGQCIAAPSGDTSFFVSSSGNGSGDFGGLVGADNFCQGLAEAASLGDKTWRAYLSTSSEDARDRIGTGPWFNAAGLVVAADVASLHANGVAMDRMLTELGEPPPISEHDILTGSTQDGRATADTCDNWTSAAKFNPKAMVGHFDSPNPVNEFDNWNSTHQSNGCDAAGLASTGGTARVYCFAL